jgi:hypothetical protein
VLKFLLLVILVAVAVYALVRVIQRRGVLPRHQPPSSPPRPLGPDDDPDFLRDLDRKRRHKRDPEA